MGFKKYDFQALFALMKQGDVRSLAKLLTAIENSEAGIDAILEKLNTHSNIPVVGITGPPGAGKSSLVNSLVDYWANTLNLKVAILAVDPSSPFNLGSLLGDRLRMSDHFTNDNVFIRSMSARGALGGLTHKIVEATDLLRNAGFDRIIIETVGVGQSEIEVAGLADTTILVLVPEGGDDVQAIKSGIMEVADIFVVNKADRTGADKFYNYLKSALHQRKAADWNPPIIKTIATKNTGIEELSSEIERHSTVSKTNDKKAALLAEKAWKLIAERRMQDLIKKNLQSEIQTLLENKNFNLYSFVKKHT